MAERRTFIAINISDAARRACVGHVEMLKAEFGDGGVRWERPEKLHVTLKFLGSVSGDVVSAVVDRVSDIARSNSPFDLQLSSAGVFPSPSKPRIFWIGLKDQIGATQSIYAELDSECADLGFEREQRKFTPHITIGRAREPERARKLAEKHLQTQVEPVEFRVAEIVVYESKLQPTGSIYSVVDAVPLNA